jgi:hypothetical protein
MAPSLNPYKKIAPNGIYAGGGVNPGGNISRPANLHMGGSGVLKGGSSFKGTTAKFPKPIKAPKLPALKPINPGVGTRSLLSNTAQTRSMTPVGTGGSHSQPVQGPNRVSNPGDGWKQVTPTLVRKPDPVGYIPRAPYDPNGPAPVSDYIQPGDQVSKPGAFQHGGNWYFLNANGRVAFIGKKKPNVRTVIKAPTGFQTKHAYGLPGSQDGTKAGGGSPSAPTTPTAPTGPVTPTLGAASTLDPQYWLDMLGAGTDYDLAGLPIAGITTQRDKVNPALWETGRENLLRTNNLNAYSSNASLAARGIFNSGERINQEGERNIDMMSSLLDLNDSVGAGYDSQLAEKYRTKLGNPGAGGAYGKLSSQITSINEARNTALGAAKETAARQALQRALDLMNSNPPSIPATPEMAKQVSKEQARKNTGWYNFGGKTYFRNEKGQSVVVDPKKATAAWKAATKRSGT